MAIRYVSSSASGSGDGSSVGSPWTIAQATAGAANSDTLYLTGTFTQTAIAQFAQSNLKLIGYGTTPGDAGMATFQAGADSISLVRWQNGSEGRQITANGNGHAGIVGFELGDNDKSGRDLLAQNCAKGFYGFGNPAFLYRSRAVSCSTSGFDANVRARRCYAASCATGFESTEAIECIANACTSRGFNNAHYTRCLAYACDTGFALDRGGLFECVAWGCTTSLQLFSSGVPIFRFARGGHTSEFQTNTPVTDVEPILLTADPCTNAAGGNFSPNNTAGGGALLRAMAFAFAGISTTAYPDVGAVQSQATGGSGSPVTRAY